MFLNFLITLNSKHVYFNLIYFYNNNVFLKIRSTNRISFDVINAYEELQIIFFIYYFYTVGALMFQSRILFHSFYLTADGRQ